MKRVFVVVLALLLASCGSESSSDSEPHTLAKAGVLNVRVVLPDDAPPGLRLAAEDLVLAMSEIAGVTVPANAVGGASTSPAVSVVIDADRDELGSQGYALRSTEAGVTVTATTHQGAAYGLWGIARDLGASWHHPEESFYPSIPTAALPADYDGTPDVPRFARRGFHEHTQHPIVASDFLLRPGDDERRAMASRYVRWLARNRQNVMSFHMLRSVDLEAWQPYMRSITDEADELFIESGVVIGFVDEQQNAFKTYRPESDDRPAMVQIADRVDQVLEGGFDFLTFQVGASEFTKPADADLLEWMDGTLAHVEANHPGVRLGAWIHITCNLYAEDGSNFFHLPLQSDTAWRAWVHTTMFYTLADPAPVYHCDDFSQQLDFIDEARDTDRELEFFPETAWWLGFDVNVPLALPLYGLSRDRDLREHLDDRTTGHVTFSSGREWGYWRYDHFLTEATWDSDVTWSSYLASRSGLFGDQGTALTSALDAFGELQAQHFYDENPLLYFYLAGELPQDEVGVTAGLAARRPKRSFREILELSDDDFAAWETTDLAALRAMRTDYAAVLDALPSDSAGADLQVSLYAEAHDGLYLYVRRLDHVIRLYEGVAALRAWQQGDESGQAAAREALADARAISAQATTIVQAGEARYRYPVELLARDKPESLTIYPYGSIAEASTGYFWTRRDDQLAGLIDAVLDATGESWTEPAPEVVFFVEPGELEIEVPEHPLARSALGSLLPGLVFGLDAAPELGPVTVQTSQDHNGNRLPDQGFQRSIEGTLASTAWSSVPTEIDLAAHDDTGERLAVLTVINTSIELDVTRAPNGVVDISGGRLAGDFDSTVLVDAIGGVTGTDPAASEELVKQVYGVAPEDPLPALLPLALTFRLTLAD